MTASHVTQERVGFIGLGNMGRHMALNALKTGFVLGVHDRRQESMDLLVAQGAQSYQSPAALARDCDVIILMLPSSPHVEEVVLGPNGLCDTIRHDSIVIDMSTISPTVSRRIAGELAARRVDFLDAPVARGVEAAKAGELTVYVGGEPSALERAMPVLRSMAKVIHHVGKVGAGEVVKLVNNAVLAATVVALSEGLVYGAKAGVDPDVLVKVLTDGAADSFALRNHIAKFALPGKLEGQFPTTYMIKDLGLFISSAEDQQVPVALASQTKHLLELVRALGKGAEYYVVVLDVLASLAGVSLRQKSNP